MSEHIKKAVLGALLVLTVALVLRLALNYLSTQDYSLGSLHNRLALAAGMSKTVEPLTVEEILVRTKDSRLERILRELISCESGWNPIIVNEVDLDGTPSFGLLQFKPSTLYSEGKKYGILPEIEPEEIMNVIYDPQIQLETALAMIRENGHQRSFWDAQFPACGRKYQFWNY